MKTLRLKITDNCNRSCPGCCNLQDEYLQPKRIYLQDVINYDMIILTGGEPLLNLEYLESIVEAIRALNPNAKIVVYTAFIKNYAGLIWIFENCDGFTLTLHEQEDVEDFLEFNDYWMPFHPNFSARLNIFSNVKIPTDCDLTEWQVKDNIVWIENCPLPANETFGRI